MIKLLENLWLKILALILGLLIWFHVATDKNYNHELYLPVVQVDLTDSLTLASNPPESLLIAVSAKGKQLLRKEWLKQGVRISALGLPVGKHEIPLSANNTFIGATTDNVTLEKVILPALLTIEIDSVGLTTVAVVPDLQATPDDGFAIFGPILVEPPEVQLQGARTKLRRFTNVMTERSELTGLRNDVELRLALALPESYGITLDPDSVTVKLKVVPVKTRVFENLPIIVYNVPPGLIVTTEPLLIDLELTGPPDEINNFGRSAITISADYRQAGEFDLAPLTIDYPSIFNLKKTSANTVKLISRPAEFDDDNPGD